MAGIGELATRWRGRRCCSARRCTATPPRTSTKPGSCSTPGSTATRRRSCPARRTPGTCARGPSLITAWILWCLFWTGG
ncbi:hypothetical protein PR202_gb26683 [Eleusine coracana subsp. coracana]|uniref:Uncharacterized protein n=1 Tax=Eleusine coracana subsp. coracana TaxID=191504 RepID=A0AAV5FSG3_ELECO|nr:hypothetical protein PR202_gb26683 [Eleusine coracana subsp. coracana]